MKDADALSLHEAILLMSTVLALIGVGLLLVQTRVVEMPVSQPSPTSLPTTYNAIIQAQRAWQGDPIAGQRVVMGATTSGGVKAACFSCHGLRGEGNGISGFPRLAGQPADYIYKQLTNFADGSRPSDTMTSIAKQLSEQQRRDAAAYYAGAKAEFQPPPMNALLQRQIGGKLALVGSEARGTPACVSCHGPNGSGMPPLTPYLAGLDAAYLENQLTHFGTGKRNNDAGSVMADIARRLSPQERQAVALYFAAVPPPVNE
mgnify:FL=1